ncbi:MAG: molybdopterin converting factor subunit 1 [Candidatus Accumulibacter sp.]|uniref:molybdopterin converting factor subunit 1 n=1 Tax=Accumulibacter sp. TaxID=2053492 RepID=UPI0019F3AE07|nr:molybdopterin converting factor subunit 1 [Accumulibacter sp.]MBE2257341.1 molybdopterin converting factor subunit 1 [Paracoccaceae bacterium]MCB1940865.1 molybdopterin converting factor subunit 1 [Accumulibacter sp.]MCP5249836.1 molybdopterin converting factor subunit 1 [Accumulibacter sp.]
MVKTVKILYFAGLRERVGQGCEQLELPAGVSDVAGLLALLAARGGRWQGLATIRNLRCAVNQEMARPDSPLRAGDEVAFFPPVTGG